MQKKSWDVIVIGGGPSGMMSAGRSAELGANVLLIEKNPTLGKKLLMTGGGRCNVTNAEFDTHKLLAKYKDAGKFLFSTFSEHGVKDSLHFFNSRNMPTKVEAENRVFPVSDSSSSVLKVLSDYLKQNKVTILSNSPVTEIKTNGNKITSVIVKTGEELFAKSFILATGGKSYPKTGSTGDGFTWLSKLGHTVVTPNSALVPIIIEDKWLRNIQGITMPDIKMSIFQYGKKIETKKGKILFTHFGISGPTVLNMSKKIGELLSAGDVIISLDILPTFDFSSLNSKLQEIFQENINKKIKNTLAEIVPKNFVPVILELSHIDPDTENNSITREERIVLMKTLKDIPMHVGGLMGPENAIVSSGGIDLAEIDWKTMRSRLFQNLYLTGDILNIDRPSGGFSLQLCWTTGFVAGSNATDKK